MLSLNRKENCCGCTACKSICPAQAISMDYDEEGFLYPKINADLCVDCNKCNNVCPIIHASENAEELLKSAYAARSTDEEVLASSTSGGLSYEIARHVIRQGGVVFGAVYGKGNVVEHKMIESIDELKAIQGSKYVQSDINQTFSQVKKLLSDDRMVLFTGTPCQIEGLLSFIGDNGNLITQDIICHGVPSPLLWEKYLKETGYSTAESITFRGKDNGIGWENRPIFVTKTRNRVTKEPFENNAFSYFFSQNYSLRSICYECPFKTGNKKADITCADLWGISEILHDYNQDDKGMSLVITNTPKGKELFDKLCESKTIIARPVSYDAAISHNMMMLRSVKKPERREEFFKDMSIMTFKKAYKKFRPKEPLILKIKKKLYPIKQAILGKD